MKPHCLLTSPCRWFAAIVVLIAGCGAVEKPDYLQAVGAEQLRRIMQNEDVFLVDVHTPEQKHIKGTDAFIPYDAIEKYLSKLPADKNTPIYLYCESGRMANSAAKVLHGLGYRSLINLDGGAKNWRKNGFELE